jgi:hypothetical protein
MDGPRYLFWNFVSSSRYRIEQAKADWKAGQFGTVPGDAREFIPLPRIGEFETETQFSSYAHSCGRSVVETSHVRLKASERVAAS